MLIQPIDYFLLAWFVLAALSTAYVAYEGRGAALTLPRLTARVPPSPAMRERVLKNSGQKIKSPSPACGRGRDPSRSDGRVRGSVHGPIPVHIGTTEASPDALALSQRNCPDEQPRRSDHRRAGRHRPCHRACIRSRGSAHRRLWPPRRGGPLAGGRAARPRRGGGVRAG